MWQQIYSDQMHIRSESHQNILKTKVANDEEIRLKANVKNYFLKQYNDQKY